MWLVLPPKSTLMKHFESLVASGRLSSSQLLEGGVTWRLGSR